MYMKSHSENKKTRVKFVVNNSSESCKWWRMKMPRGMHSRYVLGQINHMISRPPGDERAAWDGTTIMQLTTSHRLVLFRDIRSRDVLPLGCLFPFLFRACEWRLSLEVLCRWQSEEFLMAHHGVSSGLQMAEVSTE